MYRFYVEEGQVNEPFIHLTGADVNHIKNVLRMVKGDKVVIGNGQNRDYHCIIEHVASEGITLRIVEAVETNAELPCKITLFQSIPKKDKMEFVIQKAVELGVAEIVPIITKRCIVKLEDEGRIRKKTNRWRTIAESSAKQSVRGVLPIISEPIHWKEAMERTSRYDMGILPYEWSERMGIDMEGSRNILEEACHCNSLCLFIGPEGGFEEEEVKEAVDAGLKVISLGNRILRTETAGMVVLAYLMMRM